MNLKKLSIAIATPFYEVKAYSPYITSLLNSVKVLTELGIPYDYYELSGDSYVDRAKNSLIHRFLESEHTHIFMVDSDLAWDVKGFAKIIKGAAMGAEIIGGAYPNKNNWDTFGAIPTYSEDGFLMGKEIEGTRLLDMWGIPGGFILYSREAIERARPNLNSYTDHTNDTTYLECFKCNIEANKGRVGEDIYFQIRYREMGGKIWCDPDIHFEHIGVKGWQGNFHEYLMKERGLNVFQQAGNALQQAG